jgi:hypothetical protein
MGLFSLSQVDLTFLQANLIVPRRPEDNPVQILSPSSILLP